MGRISGSKYTSLHRFKLFLGERYSDNNKNVFSDWLVSYRSEVKARQDVKPDIRQPPFTDYRQPPVDYRHPPVADYRQPPTLDYRHPPLLDYRQLAPDARQFTIPEYRMPPVQVKRFLKSADLSSRMLIVSWIICSQF